MASSRDWSRPSTSRRSVPLAMSEQELDRRYGTKSKLASGGDYGCGCLVFEGDLEVEAG